MFIPVVHLLGLFLSLTLFSQQVHVSIQTGSVTVPSWVAGDLVLSLRRITEHWNQYNHSFMTYWRCTGGGDPGCSCSPLKYPTAEGSWMTSAMRKVFRAAAGVKCHSSRTTYKPVTPSPLFSLSV